MKITYLFFLIVSIFLFLFAIVLGCLIHFKNLKTRKDSARRSYVLTPFQVFLICFFVATAVLFYPVYFYDFFSEETESIRIIKSVLLSVHNTMRLFVLDGDFEIIKNAVTVSGLGYALSQVYSIYMAALFVTAPVLTAGFVLSFFKNTTAYLRLFFCRKSDIYVMSELNERSVALAEDILTNPAIKGKKVVVFADVFEREEEEVFELVEQARRLGAICFKNDITEIGLKPSLSGIKRKLYFLGNDEDENVKQSLILISRFKNVSKYNTQDTHFYVFANSVESEALLNSTDNGNMRVRRVCQVRNLVMDVLRKNSIFDTEIIHNKKKLINIVIVGLGRYGTELLKTISWLGQMDGYILQIHVFDSNADVESKIKNFAPDMVEYNHRNIEGEPYYDIFFHGGLDVRSKSFLEELSQIADITKVFIALGDDELNIETAMRMRMQFGRDALSKGRKIPEIFAIVYSSIKTATFMQNGGIKSIKNEDYRIQFVGSMKERYSIELIEQIDLETEGLKYHLYWSKTEAEVEKNKSLYEKYEYYRRSSISRALHVIYRKELGCLNDQSGNDNKMIEHKRWNAYMRADGYIYNAVKDDIAKTHHDLVPFGELKENEEIKDATIDT